MINFPPRHAAKFALIFCIAILIATIAGCNATSYAKFDENTAFSILKAQCDFGPRPPGTTAHDKCGYYIVSQLKPLADKTEVQSFETTADGKKLDLRNIIGYFNPEAKDWVILCAHWDTRPMADEEVDNIKRNKPILGANDGASGVAVLLELARIFHDQKPSVGVMMVFFDGEDYGRTPDMMLLGSEYFAKNFQKIKRPDGKPINIRYGILLDMVGDRDLQIYREKVSEGKASDVVDKVWNAAKDLGYGSVFINTDKYAISDDHVPLLFAGIKCIDVIDFDYAYWHTLDDTVDKCSPKSLGTVGEVIEKVVYDEKMAASLGRQQ